MFGRGIELKSPEQVVAMRRAGLVVADALEHFGEAMQTLAQLVERLQAAEIGQGGPTLGEVARQVFAVPADRRGRGQFRRQTARQLADRQMLGRFGDRGLERLRGHRQKRSTSPLATAGIGAGVGRRTSCGALSTATRR